MKAKISGVSSSMPGHTTMTVAVDPADAPEVFERYHAHDPGEDLSGPSIEFQWAAGEQPTEPAPTEPAPEPTDPAPTDPEPEPTEPPPKNGAPIVVEEDLAAWNPFVLEDSPSLSSLALSHAADGTLTDPWTGVVSRPFSAMFGTGASPAATHEYAQLPCILQPTTAVGRAISADGQNVSGTRLMVSGKEPVAFLEGTTWGVRRGALFSTQADGEGVRVIHRSVGSTGIERTEFTAVTRDQVASPDLARTRESSVHGELLLVSGPYLSGGIALQGYNAAGHPVDLRFPGSAFPSIWGSRELDWACPIDNHHIMVQYRADGWSNAAGVWIFELPKVLGTAATPLDQLNDLHHHGDVGWGSAPDLAAPLQNWGWTTLSHYAERNSGLPAVRYQAFGDGLDRDVAIIPWNDTSNRGPWAHLSGDGPVGWVLVTASSDRPDGTPLAGEIFAVKLDGTKMIRLLRHGWTSGPYWSQPQGTWQVLGETVYVTYRTNVTGTTQSYTATFPAALFA